jgi:hypothetical protein
VPFVFATGYGDLPRRGFEDISVLSKPINIGQLGLAVGRFAQTA